MAPMATLQGETLGEKHKHYNKLAKELFTTSKKPSAIDLGGCDLHNLLQIDLASYNRDVDFILQVFKSEDMLYVSKAIKVSTWLITEDKYSNIINPNYLHGELKPYMTSRAFNKLILQIRLKLRDQERVECFYKFYKDKDGIELAQKWLQHCSTELVEEEIKINAPNLSTDVVKRLCERSVRILELYCKYLDTSYLIRDILKETMFLLNAHPERFLNIMESKKQYFWKPDFSKKSTKTIMKVCPEKVINNFSKYENCIHIKTFAKLMNQNQFEVFFQNLSKNKEKFNDWFCYKKLSNFVHLFPKTNRYQFIKSSFIEKKIDPKIQDLEKGAYLCDVFISAKDDSTKNYNWYRFIPFDAAFIELKKMIRAESSPEERLNMLSVLLTSAKNNESNIKLLIEYFKARHVNEPFNFKIRFINSLISKYPVFRLDKETWSTLEEIFRSLEVYSESDHNVQKCIESIIVYNILKNQEVPDIIEKKFTSGTLTDYLKYLTDVENEKIFTYLLKRTTAWSAINNESDLRSVLQRLNQTMALIGKWGRDPVKCGVIQKIKELVLLNKENKWDCSFVTLYDINKKLKKYLFQESILIHATEETCLNALKHGPQIIFDCENEINDLCSNDSISLMKVMKKARIYFPETIATYFINKYNARFQEPKGHKALIQGLFCLLSRKSVMEIINKYAPDESKINWNEMDETLRSLRKQIALNMYVSRPQPPTEAVLLYAKGDYLQHALPSLNAIFQNQPSAGSRRHVMELLNAPVSVQKHGVRFAYNDLETTDVKSIYEEIWTKSKNLSIRATVFKHTLKLLSKEKNEKLITELGELISTFINNLGEEDNKSIFEGFKYISKIPLQVRGQIFVTAYCKLEIMPPQANCDSILKDLRYDLKNVVHLLNIDFIDRIINEFITKNFIQRKLGYQDDSIMRFISKFLLLPNENKIKNESFNKILFPILDECIKLWDNKADGKYYIRHNLSSLLDDIRECFVESFFTEEFTLPFVLVREIQKKLTQINKDVNYNLVTEWDLFALYMDSIEENKDHVNHLQSDDDKKLFSKKIAETFAGKCVEYLKKDVSKYFPSIHLLFKEALNSFHDEYFYSHVMKYYFYQSMLTCDKEFDSIYLVVIEIISSCTYKYVKEVNELLLSCPSQEVRIHLMAKHPNIELVMYETDDEED